MISLLQWYRGRRRRLSRSLDAVHAPIFSRRRIASSKVAQNLICIILNTGLHLWFLALVDFRGLVFWLLVRQVGRVGNVPICVITGCAGLGSSTFFLLQVAFSFFARLILLFSEMFRSNVFSHRQLPFIAILFCLLLFSFFAKRCSSHPNPLSKDRDLGRKVCWWCSLDPSERALVSFYLS